MTFSKDPQRHSSKENKNDIYLNKIIKKLDCNTELFIIFDYL